MSATLPLEVQCTHRAPLRAESRRRLAVVLGISAVVMVAEAVGGWVAHSLALLADAGHMLADVGALGLSLGVASLAQRPVTAERTFGLLRLEILAALVNGAALLAISIGVAIEALHRLRDPAPVQGALLAAVAGLRIAADSLISIFISMLILASAWRLVKESADVLLEAAPAHIALSEVHNCIATVPGVASIHDLHVWTVTSGVIAMSGHLVVQNPADNQRVLEAVQDRLGGMGIRHVTVQMERDQTCE